MRPAPVGRKVSCCLTILVCSPGMLYGDKPVSANEVYFDSAHVRIALLDFVVNGKLPATLGEQFPELPGTITSKEERQQLERVVKPIGEFFLVGSWVYKSGERKCVNTFSTRGTKITITLRVEIVDSKTTVIFDNYQREGKR
jgi:hypothetical protein